MDTKVIITNARFAYAHVFEKDEMSDKYSVRILFAKNSQNIENIKQAFIAAVQVGAAKLGTMKPKLGDLVHDGDGEGLGEEYRGMYYINAKSKTKPQIVKVNTTGLGGKTIQITDESEFFSGCYGHASITFFAYNQGVNKGIGVGLNSICKTKGGTEDYLGGRSSAESDFGAVLSETQGTNIADDDIY